MDKLEEQYKVVNEIYNQFSYELIAYNTSSEHKRILKGKTKELAKALSKFWDILNEIGRYE